MRGSATTLVDFLVAELAPTPGRGRATLRIVTACVVATALVMAFRIPEGHWTIMTIFTVGQPDAGASLRKGIQRIVGTLAGGLVGIVIVIAFADQPWLQVPLLGVLGAAALFLSRTTTAPYVGLLGGITAMIVLENVGGADVNRAVAVGLWRIVLIAGGVVIATGAQLLLWPTDPEDVLLDELGARIDIARGVVRRCLDGVPRPAAFEPAAQGGLARQLDLLANAEARHPSLRQRHVEQLTLVGAVEHLLTGALALERAALATGGALAPATRERLHAVLVACDRLRDLLAGRTTVEPAPAGTRPSDEDVAAAGAARLLPALTEMERALGDVAALRFHGPSQAGVSPAATPQSLDEPASGGGFFTPAFSSSNTDDLAFALKGGLAASICNLITNGLAWPGISTSVWSCLLVAQSSYGATVQKEILRLAGAVLGGLLGLLALVVAMPNLESLASLLVVVAIGSGIAAWITSGSARIGYAGIQIGFAFGLCVVDVPGTTVNLLPARDRVVGVLIGIVVTGFVFRALGPVLAAVQMREAMAKTLRALAALARVGITGLDRIDARPARGHRWAVYQSIATTLRLHDEAQFEAGAGRPEMVAERNAVLRLVGDAQAVFLALLEVARHRLNVDLVGSIGPARPAVHALAAGIADTLARSADRIDGAAAAVMPDLAQLRVDADAAVAALPAVAHLQARLLLYRDLVGTVVLLARDVDALAEPGHADGLDGPRVAC